MKQRRDETASERLEQWLLDPARAAGSESAAGGGEGVEIPPLPSTRALGARFGVSHATAFRLLQKLEREGHVWRAENGRFFPTAVRRYVENVLPVACLIRQLQDWSSLCRQVMEGFTAECAEEEMPLLLLQRRELLVQKGAHAPIEIADVATQTEVLKDFGRIYGDRVCGLLLDELWEDAAIEAAREFLPLTVVFYRPTGTPGIGSVCGDFAAAALLGLSHLLACGYGVIYLVRPFEGHSLTQAMLQEATSVLQRLTGQPLPQEMVLDLQDAPSIRQVARQAQKSGTRIGFFCPEDNASIYLLELLRAEGLNVPKDAGVLSSMGTSLAGEITSVQFDFRGMGRQAAKMLLGGHPGAETLEPQLRPGETTASLMP